MNDRELIYKDDARAAVLKTEPRAAYCIDRVKPVDAVEVVRCKDCKHWKPSGSMAGNSEDDLQPIGGCEWTICCRRANDFCSYGERRCEDG